MFHVRYEPENSKVELTFSYFISATNEREFKLYRDLNETIGKTFEKIVYNIEKHSQSKSKGKKLKTTNEEFLSEDLNITATLYDFDNEVVSNETVNDEAWIENYKVKINDRIYTVSVNLPCLKKLALPRVMLANMPVIAVTDKDDEIILSSSMFWWYAGDDLCNEWELIAEGINKRMIILDEQFKDNSIKIKCVPSDGKRVGIAIEVVSQSYVKNEFKLDELPMTDRHKLTNKELSGNKLRVVSYNLLAKTYGDSFGAKTNFYPYCPDNYIGFKYRRSLLIHEIMNYNADIVFLQECDEEFFENDIRNSLFLLNYSGCIKTKGEQKEGEAIIFRNDRFKYIDSYGIKLSQEIVKNNLYKNILNNLDDKDEQLRGKLLGRNTILQLVLLESREQPGNYILLANTHLYYHPKADFIRLLQTIASIKHLENVLYTLKSIEQKNVTVLFGGDLNSDPASFAVEYLLNGKVPLNNLDKNHSKLIKDQSSVLAHSLRLNAYSNFQYTNYIGKFKSTLDYVFYDENRFKLERVIPMPTHEQVTRYVALPSKIIPSDHIAIVFEFEWKLINS